MYPHFRPRWIWNNGPAPFCLIGMISTEVEKLGTPHRYFLAFPETDSRKSTNASGPDKQATAEVPPASLVPSVDSETGAPPEDMGRSPYLN
jgi:hypothetical protein